MSKFTFDSAALYTILLSAQAQMQQVLKDRTGDSDYTLRIIWWGHSSQQQWELNVVKGYSDKVEVKGKHLEQCFEEAMRRLGFTEQQEHLQLTSMVDTTATEVEVPEVPEPSVAEPVDLPTVASEDEIPL